VNNSFGAVVRFAQDSSSWPVGDFQQSQIPAKANPEPSFIPFIDERRPWGDVAGCPHNETRAERMILQANAEE
jgi:hypothetical protein